MAFERITIERIFPELKEESEDEKVIRDIKIVLERSATKFFKEESKMPIWYDRAIAWLEKQGEPKEYTFKSLPRLLDMIEPSNKAKEYCQKLIDILIQEGYDADAKIVGNCLKQMNGEKVAMATVDEQKPTWSEDDRIRITNCIRLIGKTGDGEVKWLKSLENRILPPPKQEWSEEDKLMLNDIIMCGENHCQLDYGNIVWLKSLKQKLKGE